MRLGIHQPLESPLGSVPLTTKDIGANTFQIFIRNNRNMSRRASIIPEIDLFNYNLLMNDISTYVVHAAYAMNPCSDNTDMRERMYKTLAEDLKLMNRMAGVKYYVLHPGSSKDLDHYTALENLSKTMHDISYYIGDVHIALEFMAGAGTQELCTPEDIQYIMCKCYDVPNICICFDTCHVFGAGYDILECFDSIKEYCGVLHLNNSKAAKGTHVDRHAPILSGLIAVEDLVSVAQRFTDTFPDKPVILETPGTTLLQDFLFVKSQIKM